jgi:hypothetical protein
MGRQRIQNFTGRNSPLIGLRVVDLSGMTLMQARPQQSNRVAAVFRNAALSLKIARQTTFAQLAEQLSGLAEIHGELMCPVQVRVAAPAYVSGNRPDRREV